MQKLVYLFKANYDLAEGPAQMIIHNDTDPGQETTGITESHNIETPHQGPFRLT